VVVEWCSGGDAVSADGRLDGHDGVELDALSASVEVSFVDDETSSPSDLVEEGGWAAVELGLVLVGEYLCGGEDDSDAVAGDE